MNFVVLSKGLRAQDKRHSKTQIAQYDLPGIPHAIQKRRLNDADRAFEAKKKQYCHRLPILTKEEISKHRLPFFVILVDELKKSDNGRVAEEITHILQQEELQAQNHLVEEKKRLTKQNELLQTISDSLKYSWELIDQKRIEMGITIRKRVAETLLKAQDKLWLVKLIYEGCIQISEEFETSDSSSKTVSEIKCVLGFLERNEVNLNDEAMETALEYLQQARTLSTGQTWIFQSKLVVISLRKPVSLLGFREGFKNINGLSMTTFNVATLLYLEILLSKASQLVFYELYPNYENSPSNLNSYSQSNSDLDLLKEFDRAEEITEQALKLALEIHESTSVSSAYLILGRIHLKKKNYKKALHYFQFVQTHANFHSDHETEAVAYNFLGQCYMEMENATLALEMFVHQQEISEMHNFLDLESDALQEIGRTLLEEGVGVEAELCYLESYQKYVAWEKSRDQNQSQSQVKIHEKTKKKTKMDSKDQEEAKEFPRENQNQNHRDLLPLSKMSKIARHLDDRCLLQRRRSAITNAWLLNGIATGLNIWSRFSGHCRIGRRSNLRQISEWMTSRNLSRPVPSLSRAYRTHSTGPGIRGIGTITNYFKEFDPETKIPVVDVKSVIRVLMEVNKNLLPKEAAPIPTDDKSVQAVEEIQREKMEMERSSRSRMRLRSRSKSKSKGKPQKSEADERNKVVFYGVGSGQLSDTSSVNKSIIDDFDEGEDVIYDSDRTHINAQRFSGGYEAERKEAQIASVNKKSKTWNFPSMQVSKHSSVHGGISKSEMRGRPSLNLRITSLSRANSFIYEQRFSTRDVKWVAPSPVANQSQNQSKALMRDTNPNPNQSQSRQIRESTQNYFELENQEEPPQENDKGERKTTILYTSQSKRNSSKNK